MPRPPVPRPVPRPVAARPIVLSKPSQGVSAFAIIVNLIVIIIAIGGVVWYVKYAGSSKRQVTINTAVEAPTAVDEPTVEPTPVPKVDNKPEKPVVASAPMAEAPPLPNVPERPAPVNTADAFAELLLLDGTAARGTAQVERAARLLRQSFEKNQWPQYVDLLRRSLRSELRKSPDFSSVQRYDRFTSNPYFMRAMLQSAFANLAGDDLGDLVANDQLVRQHTIWLCENNDAMESFLRACPPGNNVRRAMETWARLTADDAEGLGAYRELAIACALVLDEPVSFKWNDEQVTITAEERYAWYKSKDKAGQLAVRMTTMTAWDLAWVVDVRVPQKEMEWAVAEVGRKLKQRDWGRAYSLVPYDMQKAVTGRMKEPYAYYTFAEILKKGGVCDDQAYFATNTARSAGIPAVRVSGDGERGRHAWVAWLAQNDRWAFSGRFEGYPAGTVEDPRNGAKMSEQRFTRLSNANAPSNATMLKAQRLVWMHELQQQLEQPAEAEQALEHALRVSPRQAELWEKKIAFWRTKSPLPSPAQWKTFLDAMKREFRDDSDVLALARTAEDEFVLSKSDVTMVKNELRGDVRDLKKLKGLTSLEEIQEAHSRYAQLVLKDNDYTALRKVYRDALDGYGREAAKFKALARDYWTFVQTAPPEVRQTACRDMETVYERHVETKHGDYFDVRNQNTAAEVVAECWREAGDPARAERIEKEIAKRQKKATENAL